MQVTTLRLTDRDAVLVEDLNPEILEREQGKRAEDEVPLYEYWVDITGATPKEWEDYLVKVGMPESDREICTNLRNFPYAEDLTGKGLAMRIPLRNDWRDPSATYVNIILLPHTIITEHAWRLDPLEKTRRHLIDGDRPDITDMSWLLLYILQGVMEAGVNGMLMAKMEIEVLEDIMETDPSTVNANDLRRKKHIIEHLTGQAEEQTFALTLLRGILSGTGRHSVHAGMGELMEALSHLEYGLGRLENRMNGFLGQLDSRIRNKTDQRLRILTIISAVFMPLTFITGIYGMNFSEMPGLSSPWGYYIISLLMLVVGGGMLFYFWKKKWF